MQKYCVVLLREKGDKEDVEDLYGVLSQYSLVHKEELKVIELDAFPPSCEKLEKEKWVEYFCTSAKVEYIRSTIPLSKKERTKILKTANRVILFTNRGMSQTFIKNTYHFVEQAVKRKIKVLQYTDDSVSEICFGYSPEKEDHPSKRKRR